MNRDPEELLRDFFHEETTSLPERPGTPYQRLIPHLRRRKRARLAGVGAATAAAVVLASGVTIAIRHQGSPSTTTVAVPPVLASRLTPPPAPPSVLRDPIARAAALIETGADSEQPTSNDPILVAPTGAYRAVPLRQISADPSSSYSLSPDGTRLAIGIDSKPAATIAILTFGSGDIVRYTLRGTNPLGEDVTSISWSPDGGRIAFWASITTAISANGTRWGEGYDAGVLDLATGDITTLPAPPISWLADGHLLFSDNFTLELGDLTGANRRPIHTGSLVGIDVGTTPVAPNGQKIALISRGGDQNDPASDPHRYQLEIHSTAAAGSSAVSLGTLTGQPETIGWADDQTIVVGERSADGHLRVQAVDATTGATRLITDVAATTATAVQLPADTLAALALLEGSNQSRRHNES